MNRVRNRTDGLAFLSSLFINLLVFSLVFVYVTGGETVKGVSGQPPGDPTEVVEFVGETDINEFEVFPPTDFENESAASVPNPADYNFPQFKQVFDSYLLPGDDRGKEFIVTVEIRLDEKGNLVEEPKVVKSNGSTTVNTETVRRLKRIRFTPAKHSRTGEPSAAKMTTKVFWAPGGG